MSQGSGADLIDWDFGVSLGIKVSSDGPKVTPAEASQAVAELRAGAARSTLLVKEFTGLEAPEGSAPLLVVDRPGWIQANADSFAAILGPVLAAAAGDRPAGPAAVTAVSRKVAGAEVGGLLGFLSSKVLGQFDPFFAPNGRLLLVAPNVVAIERELGVDPADFRLWVCLHEETHRVQFTANPWLREYLLAQVTELASQTDARELSADLISRVTEAIKGRKAPKDAEDRPGSEDQSLLDLVSSESQRAIIDQITAVMSLLEGHADYVMDEAGPAVIASVADIRAKFTQRRGGSGSIDRLIRRLLGLDAKMAQYRNGAIFVRHVVEAVGMEKFNYIWRDPASLPTLAEIHDPAGWVTRVHPEPLAQVEAPL